MLCQYLACAQIRNNLSFERPCAEHARICCATSPADRLDSPLPGSKIATIVCDRLIINNQWQEFPGLDIFELDGTETFGIQFARIEKMEHECLPCWWRAGAQPLLKSLRRKQIGTDDQHPSAWMAPRIRFEHRSEIGFAARFHLLDEPQHPNQARFSLCRSELTAYRSIE
jgi:hypothetical protein